MNVHVSNLFYPVWSDYCQAYHDVPESKGSVLYRIILNLTIYFPGMFYTLFLYILTVLFCKLQGRVFQFSKKRTHLSALLGFYHHVTPKLLQSSIAYYARQLFD